MFNSYDAHKFHVSFPIMSIRGRIRGVYSVYTRYALYKSTSLLFSFFIYAHSRLIHASMLTFIPFGASFSIVTPS